MDTTTVSTEGNRNEQEHAILNALHNALTESISAYGQLSFADQQRIVGHINHALHLVINTQQQTHGHTSEERFRTLAEQSPDVIFRYRLTHPQGYEYISPSVVRMTGYTPEEYYADPNLDLKLLHPDHHARFDVTQKDPGTPHEPAILHCIHKNGQDIWIEQRHWIVRDSSNTPVAIEGISLDITERIRIEHILQRTNKQLTQAVEELTRQNHDITLLNEMGDAIHRCQTIEESYAIIGQFAQQLFPEQGGVLYMRCNDGLMKSVTSWGNIQPGTPMVLSTPSQLKEECKTSLEFRENSVSRSPFPVNIQEKGQWYWCVPLIIHDEIIGVLHLSNGHHDPAPVREFREQLAIIIARKLSLELANLQLRERLRQQAIHDPLTGLFNRRYLDETLKRELERASRLQYPVGIIMFDIDHFKLFNDQYGHDGGDALLRALGTMLQTHTRNMDVVCRYGGEEFTLILPGASLDHTLKRAEELREHIQKIQIQHLGQTLRSVTASLGVAIFPNHGKNDELIIKAADQALYNAKRKGRNRVTVYKK